MNTPEQYQTLLSQIKIYKKAHSELLKINRRLRYALKLARLERDAARNALSEENLNKLMETLEESTASLARAKNRRRTPSF